jgi:hydrogenase maturation protease
MTVRVLALGNEMASDDGAALVAAGRHQAELGVEVHLLGRPGTGLLDWLDPEVPTVVLDVVRQPNLEAGEIVEMRLADVPDRASDLWPVSSHGLGLPQALQLARNLGRPLPEGLLVGIVGKHFGPGTELSPEVQRALPTLRGRLFQWSSSPPECR